ncbi:DUF2197 domain-containing protein [Zhaonella formicivorans]|uniref:DUF2197 domain-containing protein n=1 Tax=Zhaonella formicivorans TaxID=2528593 RepID=UPI0010E60EAD
MEIYCAICGRKYEITKIHKDYLRLARDPKSPFICKNCENRVRYQTLEGSKPKKPI